MALYPQVTKQKELYQKVYPGHEMLGWYSVGAEVGAPLGVCAAVGGVDLLMRGVGSCPVMAREGASAVLCAAPLHNAITITMSLFEENKRIPLSFSPQLMLNCPRPRTLRKR
jgi:hypothetical protein